MVRSPDLDCAVVNRHPAAGPPEIRMSLRLASVVLAACAACSAPSALVTPRVGQMDIDGHVAVSDSGMVLADNSLDDALGLEKDEASPGVRADVRAGVPHFVFAWGNPDNGGDGTLTAEISDDGTTLPVGTEVATNIDLDLWSALVTFDVIPTEMFELGLGLGIHLADLEALIASRDPLTPGSILVDEAFPIPVLAVQGGFVLGQFDVSALVSGIAVEVDDDEAMFLDVDLMARFKLIDSGVSGSIALGWRYTHLDAEYEQDGDSADVDLELSGPYVAITIGF
jgi:hypothetical protein